MNDPEFSSRWDEMAQRITSITSDVTKLTRINNIVVALNEGFGSLNFGLKMTSFITEFPPGLSEEQLSRQAQRARLRGLKQKLAEIQATNAKLEAQLAELQASPEPEPNFIKPSGPPLHINADTKRRQRPTPQSPSFARGKPGVVGRSRPVSKPRIIPRTNRAARIRGEKTKQMLKEKRK